MRSLLGGFPIVLACFGYFAQSISDWLQNLAGILSGSANLAGGGSNLLVSSLFLAVAFAGVKKTELSPNSLRSVVLGSPGAFEGGMAKKEDVDKWIKEAKQGNYKNIGCLIAHFTRAILPKEAILEIAGIISESNSVEAYYLLRGLRKELSLNKLIDSALTLKEIEKLLIINAIEKLRQGEMDVFGFIKLFSRLDEEFGLSKEIKKDEIETTFQAEIKRRIIDIHQKLFREKGVYIINEYTIKHRSISGELLPIFVERAREGYPVDIIVNRNFLKLIAYLEREERDKALPLEDRITPKFFNLLDSIISSLLLRVELGNTGGHPAQGSVGNVFDTLTKPENIYRTFSREDIAKLVKRRPATIRYDISALLELGLLEETQKGSYRIKEEVKSYIDQIRPFLKPFRGELLRPTKKQLQTTKAEIEEILQEMWEKRSAPIFLLKETVFKFLETIGDIHFRTMEENFGEDANDCSTSSATLFDVLSEIFKIPANKEINGIGIYLIRGRPINNPWQHHYWIKLKIDKEAFFIDPTLLFSKKKIAYGDYNTYLEKCALREIEIDPFRYLGKIVDIAKKEILDAIQINLKSFENRDRP